MIIVKLMSLLFILFAAYMVIDVIIPAVMNKPMFTLWRYIFKGKDIDSEIKEFKDTTEE